MYYNALLKPLHDYSPSKPKFDQYMTGLFSKLSKSDKKLYPKLKDSIKSSILNMGTYSKIHNRLDDLQPEF